MNAKYERIGTPSVTLDDIKKFRQLDSKCPGHPEYRWTSGVETHDRSARAGRRDQRRHGDRGNAGWRATYNRPGFPICSTTTSTRSAATADMMEGVSQRGGVACRAPRLSQPLLDLRQQPHHDRRLDRTRVQRGRRDAVHRLTAGTSLRVGDANDTRDARAAFDDVRARRRSGRRSSSSTATSATARRTSRTRRGPRRAARRGRDQVTQEGLRLARGREVPGSRRRLRALRERHRRARRQGTPTGRAVRGVQAQYPELAEQLDRCSGASCPTAGKGAARRSPPTRRASPAASVGQGAERAREEGAVADRRLGRPRALDEDPPHVRWRGRLRGRRLRRPQLPLRHSRARHGRRRATAWRCRSCARTARASSIFLDYMRRSIRLSPSWDVPVIYIFTHDSIGVGEDGRPTSRSSSWHACAAFRARTRSGRATRTRWSRPGGSR